MKITITEKSLKHATHQFIKQFREDEYAFCSGLKKNANDQTKLLTLNKALAKFKVARNFRLKYDKGLGYKRFEPVLQIINDLDITSDPVSIVLTIESELSKSYGGSKFLSAASKLAWLLTTDEDSFSSVIIYDSYACTALKKLGYLTSHHSYDEYLIAWWDAFNDCEDLIKSVVFLESKKPNLELRAFDLQLYEIGASYAK